MQESGGLLKEGEIYRLVAGAVPVAMFVISPSGMIEMVNSLAERLFEWPREELVGKSIEVLIPERYRDKYEALRNNSTLEVPAESVSVSGDIYGRKMGGQEFPIEIRFSPIVAESGVRIVFTVTDVSSSREMEAALKKSEERFRQVVEYAPNAIVMVGPSGLIEIANAQMEKLFGYSRGELIGQPIEILIPIRYSAGHRHLRDRFIASPEARPMGAGRDLYGRKKDGAEFPIEIGLNPIETEGGTFVLSSIFDVSARRALEEHNKQALSTLRASEDRFRSIFSSVGEGILIISPSDRSVVAANSAGEKMFGSELAKHRGQSIEKLLFCRDEEMQSEMRNALIRVALGNQAENLEREVQLPSGLHFWSEISLRHAEISGGDMVLAVIRNVTERRTMEAQLRQALKLEAIGTLAGGVAHELNNLLHPILMMTELVMLDMEPDSKPVQHLRRVLDAGLKATDIVRRILDFGRVDQERHGPVNLAQVAKEGFVFIRTLLPATIELDLDVDDQTGTIVGDATEITQMLINLATNARDAIGVEVGSIKATLKRCHVDAQKSVTARGVGFGQIETGAYAMFSITDSGGGIPQEVAERIFEPFFTTKGVGEGTGLGLSVVRGIVTRHRGALRMSSRRNKGTSVEVYLPLLSEDALGPLAS